MFTVQNRDQITEEPLNLPFENSMRIIFTGYFNGFSVEVRTLEEMGLLYHMGSFGKGSESRSKPKLLNNGSKSIMRRRQFVKRNYWFKKFGNPQKSSASDLFFKQIDELSIKIRKDSKTHWNKDVIDLVSSDEEPNCSDEITSYETDSGDKSNITIIVPNSDSEGEDFFANWKPKCCVNKIKLEEKLMLSLQESFFLMYGIGCLQIVGLDQKLLSVKDTWAIFNETESIFLPKYVIYHYYRSQGYVVKPGIKFGGDYLIYKDGPAVRHADYIVVMKSNSYQCDYNWTTTLGHVRMATTTLKEIIIAEVIWPPNINDLDLPKDISAFSVKEVLLSRNIQVVINTL